MREKIKKKRLHLKKKVFFHRNYAWVHMCAVSMAKIEELKFELIDHQSHSPNLVPSDFFLFPNSKKCLSGQQFIHVKEGSYHPYKHPCGRNSKILFF